MTLSECVDGVVSGKDEAAAHLYSVVLESGKPLAVFLLGSRGRADVDDCLHDCYISVLTALRLGRLANPNVIPMYSRVAVRRLCMSRIMKGRRDFSESALRVQKVKNPEEILSDREKRVQALVAMAQCPIRYHDLLVRLFLLEEQAEQVMAAQAITLKQFQLRKWRALKLARKNYKNLR